MSIETNNAIGAYNAALKQLHETQGNSSDTGGATDFSKMVKNEFKPLVLQRFKKLSTFSG